VSTNPIDKEGNAIRSCAYLMICPAGHYRARSWLELGWAILKHRTWHLFKHRKWMD
jgi:hypothetical protein